MTSPERPEREKVASRLSKRLRLDLKAVAAARHLDLQDAVHDAIALWCRTPALPKLDTSDSSSFGTWLPPGVWQRLEGECQQRNISNVQGLAQAIHFWLQQHPSPRQEPSMHIPQRKIVANQKGGVGKTAISAGIAQAYAEGTDYVDENGGKGLGLRVLMVDFDPQGHLTSQLGFESLSMDSETLVKHMTREAKGDIRDLVVQVEGEQFGDRLHLLPASADGFVLDAQLATKRELRVREATLQQALEPVEGDYDVIVIDCPPSLGMAMDSAIYYARHRPGEAAGKSGILIPVEAEDSSADAFRLLTGQVEALRTDMRLTIEYLGLVVNKFDSRRGYIATSSLEQWQGLGDPPVIGVLQDRKEQREAVRAKEGLLEYAPKSAQAAVMREIARTLS